VSLAQFTPQNSGEHPLTKEIFRETMPRPANEILLTVCEIKPRSAHCGGCVTKAGQTRHLSWRSPEVKSSLLVDSGIVELGPHNHTRTTK